MNKEYILFALLTLGVCGCWDQVVHEYDNGEPLVSDTGSAMGDDTSIDTDSATDSNAASDSGNSVLGAAWKGFGTPCETQAGCENYPSENKRCIHSVLSMVNTPGGYCTACCTETGTNKCGPGIDCVGVDKTYVVCLARCKSNADCRVSEGWFCRTGLNYLEEAFPGKYCLPDEYHISPDTDAPSEELICPWPWL